MQMRKGRVWISYSGHMATKKLKRIVPASLARVSGFLYAVLGLIIGSVLFIASLVAAANGKGFKWYGVLLLVMVPVLYGLMGLVAGYVGSWLYNFGAGRVGGIEVEVE